MHRLKIAAVLTAISALVCASPALAVPRTATVTWTVDCNLPSGYLHARGPVATTNPVVPRLPRSTDVVILAYGNRGYEVTDPDGQVLASRLDEGWHLARPTKAQRRTVFTQPRTCTAFTSVTRADGDTLYYYLMLVGALPWDGTL